MGSQKNYDAGWVVWLQWMLLSMLGILIIAFLGKLLPANLTEFLSEPAIIVVFALVTLAHGAVIAAFQWLVLRRFFSDAKRWIIASSVGSLIAGAIAFPLKLHDWYVGTSHFQLDEIAYGVVFGFLIGVIQWLIMRTWLHHAWLWMLGSMIGWTLGMAVGEFVPLQWDSPYTAIIYGIITEGISLAFTGFILVQLMKIGLDTTSLIEEAAG